MFINLEQISNSNDFSESEIKAISKYENSNKIISLNWYALFLKSHLPLGIFSKEASEQFHTTYGRVYSNVKRGEARAKKKGISISELLLNPKYNNVECFIK